ncbi:hypothetical protein KID03_00690 [bacterium]|mgnify:FL=1|uniref:Uncharacterized protein n=1 Tax=Candidatus Scatenecus faecavium TaxID=2840915 RepID=A0A9D1FVL0_9BACT|nr:hypothetical protein [bacterium]HIS82857.1 hypothetical protein [Candidatus Scatenecus faecavium]
MPNPQIDKATFMYDPRFQSIRDEGVDYTEFTMNQSYYMNKLSSSSIHDLYNKGKQMYNTYTELYNQSNNLFIQLKNKQSKTLAKYNEYLQNYVKQVNGDESKVTSTQKDIAARESGYTVDLIRNTNNAETMASIYLDGRRNAVSMQQKGLAQSVFEDIKIT